jgi:flagellar hook assembly protein FlgD
VPLGTGAHTIKWDGLDANGQRAVPPPGDQFLFGIFGFTLPQNGIFLQAAPVLSNITVTPSFFEPSTANFLTPARPTATLTYTLDKLANVELTATNLTTGRVLRRIIVPNVPAGTGRTIIWDGRAENGFFVDKGDYRLALQATDSTGSPSLTQFALVRVFY